MGKSIKKRVLSVASKVVLSTALLSPVVMSGGIPNQAQAATVLTQGDQIASLAESLKGSKYIAGGITPGGFSGPGFVYYVYKQFGIDLPQSVNQLSKTGQALSKSEVQPGDLVFLAEKNSKTLEHVGIYLGDYKFAVSAPGTGGVNVHTFEKEEVKQRYAGARRVISAKTVDTGSIPGVSGLNKEQIKLMNALENLLGKPYGKDQNGPVYFDGEGLVEYAFKQSEISMPGSLSEQAGKGSFVSRTSLSVGDVVFFGSSKTDIWSSAIYVGDNKIALASKEIGQVVVRDLKGVYDRYYLGAKRVLNSVSVQQPADKGSALADAIVETGLKYWGTPYKYGAEYPTSGKFDCSSFTQYIYNKHGIKLPRTSSQQSKVGTYVPRSQLKKGDLVFFSTSYSNGKIAHVGVYVGDDKILHTYGAGGVKYSSMKSGWWDDHYKTARRVIK